MDLKTAALYLVVILGSALLAWGVFGSRDDAATAPEARGTPDEVADPLWYRTIADDRALEALRYRMPLLTSMAIAPEQAGPTKDEVALLCAFHEDCARSFVDQVLAQPRHGAVELSAIMEIAARVRSPHFGRLLALGLDHEAWEVRYNAADAAITQADPRAIPLLADALMERDGIEILRVIDALCRIGGDEAYGTLAYALRREDTNIRKALLVPIARTAYRPALPDVRPLLDGQDPEVRVLAAWCLMTFGQAEGLDRLVAFARDRRQPGPPRAQAVNILGSDAIDRPDIQALMRELLGDEEPPVAFEARLALAAVRDAEVVAGLVADLDSDYADRRRRAIGILAASGQDEHIELLEPRVARMNLEEFSVLLEGAGRGKAPRALALIAAYAHRLDDVGRLTLRAFKPFGDEALPALAELVRRVADRVRKIDLMAAIAAIETPGARAVLESFDFSREREYWRAQRTLIARLDLVLARR